MLKTLRKNTKTLLWIAAIVFILATFMGLGGYFFYRTPNVVAKVNGKKISYETFNNIYYQRLNTYRNLYNIDVNEEMAQNLKKVVLDEIIQQELLWQEARKQKIKVTDQELSDYITSSPYFQRDGKFDRRVYLDILKYNLRMEPAAFEKEIKQTLIINKLKDKVSPNVTVTDKEVEDEFNKRNPGKSATMKPEEITKQKAQIRQFLLMDKKNKIYQDWYTQLKNKAKIVNNLEKVEREINKIAQQ